MIPFVSRTRHQAALAEITALRRRVVNTEQRHDQVEDERRDLAKELAVATAANVRLTGRVRRLWHLLEHHRDQGSLGLLRQHRTRLDRALRGCARYMAAYWKARAENASLNRQVARTTETLATVRLQWSHAEDRAKRAEALLAQSTERPIDGAPLRPGSEELRLRQELHRSRRAQAALDEQRSELIRINDTLSQQLRDHSEGATA